MNPVDRVTNFSFHVSLYDFSDLLEFRVFFFKKILSSVLVLYLLQLSSYDLLTPDTVANAYHFVLDVHISVFGSSGKMFNDNICRNVIT